jgi:hypothetical protein
MGHDRPAVGPDLSPVRGVQRAAVGVLSSGADRNHAQVPLPAQVQVEPLSVNFAAGVALRRVWLLVLGALGVIQVVPVTAVRYLPPSVGAPLALLTVGLVLIGAALWLARWWKRPGSPR